MCSAECKCKYSQTVAAAQVAGIFAPGSMTVTVSGSHPEAVLPGPNAWEELGSSYALIGTASHQPPLVGSTLFLSFDRVAELAQPLLTPEAVAAEQLAQHAPNQHGPGEAAPGKEATEEAELFHSPMAPGPQQDGSTFTLGSFEAPDRLSSSDTGASSSSTTPRSSLSPPRETLGSHADSPDSHLECLLQSPDSPCPQGLLRPEQLTLPALPAGQAPDPLKSPKGPLSAKEVLAKHSAHVLEQGGPEAVHAHLAHLIQTQGYEDPVYVIDLGCAARLMQVRPASFLCLTELLTGGSHADGCSMLGWLYHQPCTHERSPHLMRATCKLGQRLAGTWGVTNPTSVLA